MFLPFLCLCFYHEIAGQHGAVEHHSFSICIAGFRIEVGKLSFFNLKYYQFDNYKKLNALLIVIGVINAPNTQQNQPQ